MKTIKKNDNPYLNFECYKCGSVFKGAGGWQITVHKTKVSETTFLCDICKKQLDKS